MKGTVRLAGILGALVGATAFAFAEDVDWKVFGGATLGVVSVCFFDAKSVAHTSDGRVRAWTKCLPQKDLENVDFKNDRGQKIAEKAAKKIVQGYVPPLIVIGQVDFDKIRVPFDTKSISPSLFSKGFVLDLESRTVLVRFSLLIFHSNPDILLYKMFDCIIALMTKSSM